MTAITPETLREWAKRIRAAIVGAWMAERLDAYASAWEADRRRLEDAGDCAASAWEDDRKVAEWKHAFDKGEVVGLGATGMETDNPYPEGSNEYCGWSFGFWSGRSLADRKRLEAAEQALQQIAKGEGRYSRDLLTHASNTIEDMKAIAVSALALAKEEKP